MIVPRSISLSLSNQREHGEDSPVMNETLSVIDEHITDMNTPRSSLMVRERRGTNDSSSEYSSRIDQRLSYIAGHETDDEERELHSRDEVTAWSPEQVAQGLREIGVETRHCEIFKEQEITGEVLLGMDQASIFMKEFDLGLVGRRLRTWHKIKAFQDEIRTHESATNTTLSLLDGSSDDYESPHKRKSSYPPTLPQIPSLIDGPDAWQMHSLQEVPATQQLLSPQMLQRHRSETNSTPASLSHNSGPESPHRPSAASVRELNHSRRHSAVDFGSALRPETPLERGGTASPSKATTSPHRKIPSLDRNWTMGSFNSALNGRPFSTMTTGLPLGNDRNTFDPNHQDSVSSDYIQQGVDRGYASGGEIESKKSRNVLKKRDIVSASHPRQTSVPEDLRRPVTTTTSKRQSRFGSVDSIRDTVASITAPASKLYHGNSLKGRFRNSSFNGTSSTAATVDLSNNLTSPAVTKLEYEQKPRMSIFTTSPKANEDASSNGSPHSSLSTPKSPAKPRIGLRAISDAVTGVEKALVTSPASRASPIKENPMQSPTRTDSTTPSGTSYSLELENADTSKFSNGIPVGVKPARAATRRKPKKETSAYVRGLAKTTPQEQMIGCDYSGWMKKKSSNIMKTWKPRLFILRGRRLSYFYSENDTEEKGLIDISSHRVLPADSDFITGIHATVTGAKASPVSPSNAQSPTIASVEAAAAAAVAAHSENTTQKSISDTIFIFKLVPPRAGLSRAVNFTKPTVHYFAVDNITQGRLWMAALMKATIDRDETKPVTTTFQQKTISLVKARALRHRPPALMGLDDKVQIDEGSKSDDTGLNILGLGSDEVNEPDRKRAGSLDVESRGTTAIEALEGKT